MPLVETLEEARCLLGVVHAEREVCRKEKELAYSRVKESMRRIQLYRIHAQTLERKLHQANRRVGKARSIIRRSGQSAAFRSVSYDEHSSDGE
jgi:hypothetical protein